MRSAMPRIGYAGSSEPMPESELAGPATHEERARCSTHAVAGSGGRAGQQDRVRRMPPDHPLGDAGLEQVPHAAMVLVAEHDKVHVELLRALEDNLGDVMLRRAHDFPVGFDAPRSHAVN